KLEKMKSICLQYASAAQWLVTYSNDSPNTESPNADRYKKLKLRSRSQLLNVAPENATVVESIL
ncbi:Gamma-tubulin complex component 2, partial [Striga hermonthica]